MWYLLIVVVAAGHIHQFQHEGPFFTGYRNQEDCEADLSRLPKPKKGVSVVTLECREATPELRYFRGDDE